MRPRVFPAEDSTHYDIRSASSGCFNEAAGIPRGRLVQDREPVVYAPGFNEAAGIPRGRRATP